MNFCVSDVVVRDIRNRGCAKIGNQLDLLTIRKDEFLMSSREFYLPQKRMRLSARHGLNE